MNRAQVYNRFIVYFILHFIIRSSFVHTFLIIIWYNHLVKLFFAEILQCWIENILTIHCHWFWKQQPSPCNFGRQYNAVCTLWLVLSMHARNFTFIFGKKITQIAKFIGPTWGPPGSCRPQMGPMLAPWTVLSCCLAILLSCCSETSCHVWWILHVTQLSIYF